MTGFIDTIQHVLGLNANAKDLTFLQISLRAIIVFVVAIIMVRVGSKRFMSKMTAFDAVLGFIMASMLARAVNGTAAFFPTLGGGFVLMGLHALFAHLAYRFDAFGNLVKGTADIVARDGKLDREKMERGHISEKDILEAARVKGQVRNLDDIELATLERSGEISIVPKD